MLIFVFKAFLSLLVVSMRSGVQNYVGWWGREVERTDFGPFQADFGFSEQLEMNTTRNECWVAVYHMYDITCICSVYTGTTQHTVYTVGLPLSVSVLVSVSNIF